MPKSIAKSSAKPKTAPYAKVKDPKDSHLYTDDNPATTIHGTGFKDKAAAHRTLDLIKDRSLTYQFQTVNTMYYRAKHHPAMKKNIPGSANTQDMRDAMDIFKHWLDVTYPEQRDALRYGGFKPLLGKACVEKYLPHIEDSEQVSAVAQKFANVYVKLPKGKKMANVLVNESKPMEADWERLRYDSLDQLVPADHKPGSAAGYSDELWDKTYNMPSSRHLELIAWAWSPMKESKLA